MQMIGSGVKQAGPIAVERLVHEDVKADAVAPEAQARLEILDNQGGVMEAVRHTFSSRSSGRRRADRKGSCVSVGCTKARH
jgi:hypothetical protein